MAVLKNDKFISVPDRFGLAPKRAATGGKVVGGVDSFFGGEAHSASSIFSCSWTRTVDATTRISSILHQSLAHTLHGQYRHSFFLFFFRFDDCHARSL